MGTGKMEFSPSLFLFKHILLDHIKRRRPNIQNRLMKPHLRKVITPLIHRIFLKFQKFQIPNIERHFNFLINQSDSENNNLELMKQFFDELKKELLSRIENDKNCWFPSIKVAAETLHGEYYGEKFQPDTEENDSLEEKLDDLKSLFVIHLKGEYDLNLCHGVIFAIYSLEKDIKQHNRIRNRILRPIADGMLEACRNKSFK